MSFVRVNKLQSLALLLAALVMAATAIGFNAQPRWFTQTATVTNGFAATGLNGLRCEDGLTETKLTYDESATTIAGTKLTLDKPDPDGSLVVEVEMSSGEGFYGIIFKPRWDWIGAQPDWTWKDRYSIADQHSSTKQSPRFNLYFGDWLRGGELPEGVPSMKTVRAISVCTGPKPVYT